MKSKFRKAMPSTAKSEGGKLFWRKRGGHAGTQMIWKSKDKFEALGFKPKKHKNNSCPDGSVVGHGDTWFDAEGNEVSFTESYGVTANYNSYSITFIPKRA
jgi:hypothetical protein